MCECVGNLFVVDYVGVDGGKCFDVGFYSYVNVFFKLGEIGGWLCGDVCCYVI